MARKPDPYVRKVIALPAETWSEISEYRHEERISTETEAIRSLLLRALRAWRPAAGPKPAARQPKVPGGKAKR